MKKLIALLVFICISACTQINITDLVTITDGAAKGCKGIVEEVGFSTIRVKVLECAGSQISPYEDITFPENYVKGVIK